VSPSSDGAPAAQAVLAALRPRLPGTGVLLLDGASGSGKTTLAAWLARRLSVRVLAMEDLYPGWDGLDRAADLLAARILPALAAGRPACWRRWDWAADRPGPVEWIRPGRPLIVEGCGALTAASRRYADVAMVLDVPPWIRRSRILQRDPPEALPGHARWAVQERRMQAREPAHRLADLVLRGGVLLPSCAQRTWSGAGVTVAL
jgi:hypothetical protein